MSRAIGTTEEVAGVLRHRLDEGLHRIAFFIVPSSMAFLALGDMIAAVLYQTGKFTHTDANYVWAISRDPPSDCLPQLSAGSAHQLTTLFMTLARHCVTRSFASPSRRYSDTFAHCLCRDVWVIEVGSSRTNRLGVIAGWVEFALLRRTLNRRIGRTGLSASYVIKLWTAAILCAGVGWAFKLPQGELHPIRYLAVVLGNL